MLLFIHRLLYKNDIYINFISRNFKNLNYYLNYLKIRNWGCNWVPNSKRCVTMLFVHSRLLHNSKSNFRALGAKLFKNPLLNCHSNGKTHVDFGIYTLKHVQWCIQLVILNQSPHRAVFGNACQKGRSCLKSLCFSLPQNICHIYVILKITKHRLRIRDRYLTNCHHLTQIYS